MNGTLTPEMENDLKKHMERKAEARDEKGKDKRRAKEDKSFHSCTFDLEAVLSTPCSLVGQFYYKRKLSCYNLSFYFLVTEKVYATCRMNHMEGEDRRKLEVVCLCTFLDLLTIHLP